MAETRFRDLDGRMRKVTATAGSPSAARALLKERLLGRSGYGSGGVLSAASPFEDLVVLWLSEEVACFRCPGAGLGCRGLEMHHRDLGAILER